MNNQENGTVREKNRNMFSLREGEENMTKGGVNGFGREHGNKCAKPMKVEDSEDMSVLPSSFEGGCANPQGVFQGSEDVIGHE